MQKITLRQAYHYPPGRDIHSAVERPLSCVAVDSFSIEVTNTAEPSQRDIHYPRGGTFDSGRVRMLMGSLVYGFSWKLDTLGT